MVMSTRTHQTALFVVFESEFQMVSDSPAAYEGQKELEFLKAVPASWDETRVLNGVPPKYITIARRRGNEWFVGSITDWDARELDVPLSFLGSGAYDAEIYADGPNAATQPKDSVVEKRRVDARTVLKLKLAPGGGSAIRLAQVPVIAGADFEPCAGGGPADQTQDLVVVGERLGGPVLADLTEQAAFNRVVLGGAGGIVGHGDGETQAITEVLLEVVFPGASRGGIAAAGVGQDQQVSGVWVAQASFPTPPPGDGRDGEGGGLVADADEHRTAVGLGIINAEGEGDARGEGAKVVVVDRGGDALPLLAGILEVAHQFPLLGVDTDDGIAVTAEATSQSGNVTELLVA
jgi:hypothetical protein